MVKRDKKLSLFLFIFVNNRENESIYSMRKITFNEDQVKDIISLYKNDIWGTRQIGVKYSVSEKTINRILKENDVNMDTPGRRYFGGKKVADKKYYESNKEKISQYYSEWKENKKEYLKEYQKKWREENRDKLKKTKRDYERNRKASDPLYKLISNFRTAIYQVLKESNVEKNKHYFDILQYTPESLINHLESQFEENMNWENYGEWHVDHKLPITSFNIQEMGDEEFMRCWSLDNLQPMWGTDNIRKSNKVMGTE
jgi:molecular chaperone GrpE (heat shock protein)